MLREEKLLANVIMVEAFPHGDSETELRSWLISEMKYKITPACIRLLELRQETCQSRISRFENIQAEMMRATEETEFEQIIDACQ